ncbi:MAG: SecDF P1 head subdomain-containing protein [Lachnospiraceae bacterium]
MTVSWHGEGIQSARLASQKDSYGNSQYVVSLMFTDDGAKAFAEATARNIGKPIYIIYDGEIISYPTVNTGDYKWSVCHRRQFYL